MSFPLGSTSAMTLMKCYDYSHALEYQPTITENAETKKQLRKKKSNHMYLKAKILEAALCPLRIPTIFINASVYFYMKI